MSWQKYIIFTQGEYEPVNEVGEMTRMQPGLTNTYDRELREKAGINMNPIPPEYMGLEGEYDPFGLARRVAKALDTQTHLSHIDTLTLVQKGNAIAFSGQVPDHATLKSIVDITSHVDGTHAVDISDVVVKPDTLR